MNNDGMKVYHDAYHNLRDLAGQVDKMQEHHEAYHKLRELDVRIAQDIFDWVRLDEFPNEQLKGHKWGAVSMDAETLCIVPHYSTDIAAAWEIVQALNQQGYTLRLTGPEIPDTTGYLIEKSWSAAFVDAQYAFTNVGQDQGKGSVPSLAICRAALEVMVE